MQKGRGRRRGRKQFQVMKLGRKRHKRTHRRNVRMHFYLATKSLEQPLRVRVEFVLLKSLIITLDVSLVIVT